MDKAGVGYIGANYDYSRSGPRWVTLCPVRAGPSGRLAAGVEPAHVGTADPRPASSRRMQGAAGPWAGIELAPCGGTPKWNGRNQGRRQERRWASSWSPEHIASRLCIDFPDDEAMRILHEAIYQALYIQGRGALKRELAACLRTGRALRVPRARARQRPAGHVTRR
jgi:hypothetical protein